MGKPVLGPNVGDLPLGYGEMALYCTGTWDKERPPNDRSDLWNTFLWGSAGQLAGMV